MAFTSTHDGEGNVTLYGASATSDGEGNVVVEAAEAVEGAKVLAMDEVTLASTASASALQGAQGDIAALAERVTAAEASIAVNAEGIEMAATRSEFETWQSNHYTKTEADAAINLSAEAVRSSVSNTYATKDELAETNSTVEQTAESVSATVSRVDASESKVASLQLTADGLVAAVGVKDPVRSVSGSMLAIEGIVEGMDLMRLEVYGAYDAETLGTPEEPVEVGTITDVTLNVCGGNLLPFTNVVKYNSNCYSIDGDGYITLLSHQQNNINTAGFSWDNAQHKITMLPPGTYTLLVEVSTPSSVYRETKLVYEDGSTAVNIPQSTIDVTVAGTYSYTFEHPEAKAVGVMIKSGDGIYRAWLVSGDSFKEYEPYTVELIGVVLGSEELAALPDGTRDKVVFDASATDYIEKNVGKIESYAGEDVGDTWLSTTGMLTEGATVYYKLAAPEIIELGGGDMPTLKEGTNCIWVDSEPTTTLTATYNVIEDNNVTKAARTATDYLRFSEDGLVIGDMTADGLGKNVRIDADSVDIRDGEDVLASFSHSDTSPLGEARSCTNLESSGTDDLNVIAPDGLLRLMAGTGDLSTLSGVVVGGNSVTLGVGDGSTASPFGGGSVSVGADGVSIGSPEGVTVASGTAVKSLLSPFQVHAVSVHPSAATSLAAVWRTVPCATEYGSSGSLLSASGDGGVRCSRAGKVMCMASLYAQYAASAVIQLGFRTSSGKEVGGTSTNSPGWNCGVASAPTIMSVEANEVVYLMAADWNGSGASVPAADATMLAVWYVE